jgi:hypothetical protein
MGSKIIGHSPIIVSARPILTTRKGAKALRDLRMVHVKYFTQLVTERDLQSKSPSQNREAKGGAIVSRCDYGVFAGRLNSP